MNSQKKELELAHAPQENFLDITRGEDLSILHLNPRHPDHSSPQNPHSSNTILDQGDNRSDPNSPEYKNKISNSGNTHNSKKKKPEISLNKIGKRVGGFLGVGMDAIGLGSVLKPKYRREKKIEKLSSNEIKIQKTKLHMRRTDTLAGIIMLAINLMNYFENEEFYEIRYHSDGTVAKDRNTSSVQCYILRSFILVFTLAADCLIVLHYKWTLELLKLKKLRLAEDTLYTSGLLKKIFIEVFYVSICTPPGLDFYFTGTILGGEYSYSIDAIIFVVTLGKLYLILRLYQQYSFWTSDKAISICKKFRCEANVGFAIKAELKKRPYVMIAILMTTTIVILGLAMRRFEISYAPNSQLSAFDFQFVLNAFWLIIITMTTVGFGEGYPSTHLGRIIGVCACILGMLLVSLMVVSLTLSSEFTSEQKKAYFMLKKHYANQAAKEKAANVLRSIFKIRMVVKQKKLDVANTFVSVTKLKKEVALFRTEFRIANAHNLPIDEMLKHLQEKLENDIAEIKKEVVSIPELEKRCETLKEQQVNVACKLDEIIKIQSNLAEFLVKLNNSSK